ncbi:MAG: HAMP domain-containing protein [Chloroflexi bacterium]|nr:HAMP domain-containing protein [Chloroflexota bacterium]
MKFEVFGRLWVRLLAVTVIPILITVVSVALLANYVTVGQFEGFLQQDTQQRDDRLESVLERYFQTQASWHGSDNVVQGMAALVGERVVVTDETGLVVSDSSGQLTGQQAARTWRRATPLTVNGKRVGTVYINPTLPGRASSLKVQAFLESVNRSLVIGCVLAVVVGVGLTVVSSIGLRRQLTAVLRVTREIGRGNLSLRLPEAARGDLGDLASAVNHMAEDLDRHMQARQQMVADIAHELRNPLQNISGYIEALRDGVLPADDRTLNVLHSETGVLRRLVNDLQDLSVAESGSLSLRLQPVLVQDQAAALLASMQPRAEELGIEFSSSVPAKLPEIIADEQRLRQVLGNLVTNAFNYTPPGGRVAIGAAAVDGGVEISVIDSGAGIAAEDQARIFERFYRVDPARSRATGGAGLGLTIARELVHAMEGEIGVRSEIGQGSRFWIRLPRAVVATRARARASRNSAAGQVPASA